MRPARRQRRARRSSSPRPGPRARSSRMPPVTSFSRPSCSRPRRTRRPRTRPRPSARRSRRWWARSSRAAATARRPAPATAARRARFTCSSAALLLLAHRDQPRVGLRGHRTDLAQLFDVVVAELVAVAVQDVDDALADREHARGRRLRLGDAEHLVEVRVHRRWRDLAGEHAGLGRDRGLDDRRRIEWDQQVLDVRAPGQVADRLPAERELIAHREKDGASKRTDRIAEQRVDHRVAIRHGRARGERVIGGERLARRLGDRLRDRRRRRAMWPDGRRALGGCRIVGIEGLEEIFGIELERLRVVEHLGELRRAQLRPGARRGHRRRGRGQEQADGGARRSFEHRARRDRDAELEPEIHGQRFEIDEAVLEQHGAESAAIPGLGRQRLLELGLGQSTVAQQHLAEPHPSATVARRFHPPKFASRRRIYKPAGVSRASWYSSGVRYAPLAVAIIAASCGGRKTDRAPEPTPVPGQPPVAPQVALPATPPPFPEGTHSLELVRTVGVRLEPADDAKRIGTVAIDTRVGWTQVQRGHGCDKPWIELQPRGWICGDFVKASPKPPYGLEVPQLDRGEIVPGICGKVTAPRSLTYTLAQPEKKADKKKKPKKGPVKSPKA